MASKRLLLGITVCLLLAGSTLAVYWPVGRYEFLALDDSDYVTDNPMVRAGLTWHSVQWAFSECSASNWHPLTWISHMLDCESFGMDPGGHHLVSVGLHIANTLLLLLLLTRMTQAFWRSTIVAALFALHPLHVESVAWISERKDVLSAFFFMLTLLAYVRYSQRKAEARTQESSRPRRFLLPSSFFFLLALFLFALGLMSKPMLVTVPFVLLLLDYWPLRRFASTTLTSLSRESRAAANQLSTLRPLLLEKLPFFVLAAASCVLTLWAQQKGNSVAGLDVLPLFTRCINSLISYFSYGGKLLWPVSLAAYYPYLHEPNFVIAGLSALVLLSISVWALSWRRSRPYLLVGWLWFLGMLVPVIGIVQVGNQSMADRYTYLPSIGFFLMVVWLVADLAEGQRSEVKNPSLAPYALPLRTTGRGHSQRQAMTSADALVRQGVVVQRPEAGGSSVRARFERSPELAPSTRSKLVVIGAPLAVLAACAGLTSFQVKSWRNTRTLFEHALKVTGQNFMACMVLGASLADEGKNEEALEYFKSSIQFMPSYSGAWFGMGRVLFELGKRAESLECARKGLELNPDDPQGAYSYAYALLRQERWAEAERYLRQAIQFRANYPEAHLQLAIVLAQRGDAAQAADYYRLAIKERPDRVVAMNNLAWLLATHPDPKIRNGVESVQMGEQAVKATKEREPIFLGTLAAAYAEAGRFDDAVRTGQSARDLAQSLGNKELAERNEQLLQEYRAGKPHREPLQH